jgi:diguanylate cyclase (GGDEF)-like protein/PAS domain S-box-containing protein
VNLEELALHLTNELKIKYFDERDFLSLKNYFATDFSLIGTGKNEFSASKEEASEAIIEQIKEYSGKFVIENSNFFFTKLSDTSGLVYGYLKAIPEDHEFAEEDVRLTLCFEGYPDLKLSHIHFSHPDYTQLEGKYYISSKLRKDTDSLRTDLDAYIRQLENLTTKVPGGAHQCLNDDYLTFASLSDSFLNMFGFTKREIIEKFNNQYINMIYPEDRQYVLDTVKNHGAGDPNIDFEYRVLNHENKPIWILDKCSVLPYGDDDVCFYCILIEIESRKKQQEELRLLLERYQVVANQITDIVFEWDLVKDELVFSTNWSEKFGYDPIPISLLRDNTVPENIHLDDVDAFMQLIKNINEGSPHIDTEIRIRNKYNKYIWVRIRFTLLYDQNKTPIRAIGILIDIDDEKKQKENLMDQAQKDALTGLFNKSAINRLVSEAMEHDGHDGIQALFIIDVDNFKQVNDTYGHLVGDRLLSDVAMALKSKTRATDLIGRVGGDEFLIYFSHIASVDGIKKRAQVLIDSMHDISLNASDEALTVSIGIAIFNRNTVDYLSLYQHADEALYDQKSKGRDGYTIYQQDSNTKQIKTASGTPIVSDDLLIGSQRLSQYALNTLHASTNLESDIQRMLEIIAKYYDVSRAYIFENDENNTKGIITFEWDILREDHVYNDEFEYIDSLANYEDYFDENRILCFPNVDTADHPLTEPLVQRNIKSMLQYIIIDDGKFSGGVGFEDCRETKSFTDEEIKSFRLTSSVLAIFLLQLRLKQRLKKCISQ